MARPTASLGRSYKTLPRPRQPDPRRASGTETLALVHSTLRHDDIASVHDDNKWWKVRYKRKSDNHISPLRGKQDGGAIFRAARRNSDQITNSQWREMAGERSDRS